MRDYARHLIRKFDKDSDGIITFQELCEGLAKLSIFISSQEKQALMECLDIDRDGQITEAEMFRVLSQGSPSGGTSNAGHDAIADATIKKIAAGASKFGSMQDYVRDLVRRFDRNSDGLLSIGELTDGLKKIGITLNSLEVQALMKRLDLNRDGEVSADEILTVLGGSAQSSSIDKVIQKLQDGGKSFSSMKDYCKHLIKKFDRDNDGIITFTELCDGLLKLNIMVAGTDKRALMERLDLDRDGKITEHELYRVISGTVSDDLIEQTVKKIAAGAKKFSSMAEYVKDLVRKFDRNSDGFLSMQELTDGLAKIGIFLTQKEV